MARPFLQETIRLGPEGMQTAIETFPQIRPFFRSTGEFFAELQPGARALRRSAPTLASAFTKGIEGLEGSPGFNRRLSTYLGDLEDFATDPLVPIGFKDLVETVKALDPALSHITPAQTVCNYMSLFFRNAASLLSDGDQNGTWLRFMVVTTPVGVDGGPAPNGEGGPSAAPANGGGRPIDRIDPNFLHVNPYPNTAVARPGARVRGRQRDLRAGQAVDRQRARQPGRRDRRAGLRTGGGRVMAASPQTSPKHIVPRRLRGRINPVRAGAIALLIIVVGTWLAFTKSLPWKRPVPVPRGLPDLEQPAPRLARADRRRERGRGRRRSSARRTPTWSR